MKISLINLWSVHCIFDFYNILIAEEYNSVNMIFGSLGMLLGALNWGYMVIGLGIIITGATFLTIIGWFTLIKSRIAVKGI